MTENIELGFPVGAYALLLGNLRQIDMIGFQSVKGMVAKTIDLSTGYSIQSVFRAKILLLV